MEHPCREKKKLDLGKEVGGKVYSHVGTVSLAVKQEEVSKVVKLREGENK